MAYEIVANGKLYTISLHASQRMLWRDIDEDTIVTVLENGILIERSHGNDLYQYEVEENGEFRVLKVVVDEEQRMIVTVMEDTSSE